MFTRVPGGGKRKWIIYTDSCERQNKHNTVVKYLIFLAHSNSLVSVSLRFRVKGHTKDHCDRGFSSIKRKYACLNLCTLEQLCEAVEASSTTNARVDLESNDDMFRDFKTPLNNLYKNLNSLQSYQLLTMSSSDPSAVVCQDMADSVGDRQVLLKGLTTTELFTEVEVAQFWSLALTPPLSTESQP